jgi:hypothetical protein
MSKHLFIAAWLLAASAAHAELRVSYDVDLKSFVKGVAAGDTLTFDLHTSSACTAPFLTTNLLVGSEDLSVEEVKPVAAKGQRPKPKKIARLSARLQTAATSIPLFAVVSGSDGPLAGCQAQARSVPPSPLWISAYEFDGVSDTTPWFHSSAGDVSNGGAQEFCFGGPGLGGGEHGVWAVAVHFE